jgi:hypothetical protein
MTQNVDIGSVSVGTSAGVVESEHVEQNAFAQQMTMDLSGVFFNLQEFAEPVRYYHSARASWRTYNGLFEDPTTTARIDDASILDFIPQVMLSEKHMLTAVLKADRLVIRGVNYGIESAERDGFGIVTVYLRRR